MTAPRFKLWHLFGVVTLAAVLCAAYYHAGVPAATAVIALYTFAAWYQGWMSLVELAVCVSIIGMLCALLLPSVNTHHGRRRPPGLSVQCLVVDEETGVPVPDAALYITPPLHGQLGRAPTKDDPAVTLPDGSTQFVCNALIVRVSQQSNRQCPFVINPRNVRVLVTCDGYEPLDIDIQDLIDAYPSTTGRPYPRTLDVTIPLKRSKS